MFANLEGALRSLKRSSCRVIGVSRRRARHPAAALCASSMKPPPLNDKKGPCGCSASQPAAKLKHAHRLEPPANGCSFTRIEKQRAKCPVAAALYLLQGYCKDLRAPTRRTRFQRSSCESASVTEPRCQLTQAYRFCLLERACRAHLSLLHIAHLHVMLERQVARAQFAPL